MRKLYAASIWRTYRWNTHLLLALVNCTSTDSMEDSPTDTVRRCWRSHLTSITLTWAKRGWTTKLSNNFKITLKTGSSYLSHFSDCDSVITALQIAHASYTRAFGARAYKRVHRNKEPVKYIYRCFQLNADGMPYMYNYMGLMPREICKIIYFEKHLHQNHYQLLNILWITDKAFPVFSKAGWVPRLLSWIAPASIQ